MSDNSLAAGDSTVSNGDKNASDASIGSAGSNSITHEASPDGSETTPVAELITAVSSGNWSADISPADVASASAVQDDGAGASCPAACTAASSEKTSSNTLIVDWSAPDNVITSPAVAGSALAGTANSSGTASCDMAGLLCRNASALNSNGFADQVPSRPASMSLAHWSKRFKASAHSTRNSRLASFWSASQWLSNCSNAQAALPNSFKPTMRPLPLSV